MRIRSDRDCSSKRWKIEFEEVWRILWLWEIEGSLKRVVFKLVEENGKSFEVKNKEFHIIQGKLIKKYLWRSLKDKKSKNQSGN